MSVTGEPDERPRRSSWTSFAATRGCHRKYAIRLLNGPPPEKRRRRRRPRGVSYDRETLVVLTAVWEAAGYPWSVRLKALLPAWMPWIRKRFRAAAGDRAAVAARSARGRSTGGCQQPRRSKRRCLYGRTKPGDLLKHQIPVKTDRWDVASRRVSPKIDLVSHSGNSASGEFAHSLEPDRHSHHLDRIARGAGAGEQAVQQALNRIAEALPFRLRGVDSDNGSEFINWHL